MKFIEDGKIAGARLTKDGYLVANVRCARIGIQDYDGYYSDREGLVQYLYQKLIFQAMTQKPASSLAVKWKMGFAKI